MLATRFHTATDLLTEIVRLLDYQEKCVRAGSKLPLGDAKCLWQLRRDAAKFLAEENKLKDQCKQLKIV